MPVNQVDIDIGNRLNILITELKEMGITDKDGKMNNGVFALSIGLDPSQFSKIKTGEIGITLKQVLEISSIYNVRTDWILKGEAPIFANANNAFDDERKIVLNLKYSELQILEKSLDKLKAAFSAPKELGKANFHPFENLSDKNVQNSDQISGRQKDNSVKKDK